MRKAFFIKLGILMAVWFLVLAAIVTSAAMRLITWQVAVAVSVAAAVIYIGALSVLIFGYIRSANQHVKNVPHDPDTIS